MNKIDEKLKELELNKKLGLMTHLVVGYPTLEDTVKLAKIMTENGADFIELQIPFSDPLADGPTIMRACEKSLLAGTKVKDAFKTMKTLSSRLSIPLIFMAYFNTVFKYGVEKFCQDAKSAGASGLIVPDMPIDEEGEEHFYSFCQKYNLYNIQVISPISTDERLKKNAKVTRGFVYATAHQGITGTKNQLDPAISSYLKKVRKFFNLPIAVGFGISKKEHLKQLAPIADIAVIGSAIIDIISKSKSINLEKNLTSFLSAIDLKV